MSFFVPVTFYVLCSVFVLTVLGTMAEVYRSYREHKRKREDEDEAGRSMMWPSDEDAAKYQDSLVNSSNSSMKKTAFPDVSWCRMT
jgi:hypothetical protein